MNRSRERGSTQAGGRGSTQTEPASFSPAAAPLPVAEGRRVWDHVLGLLRRYRFAFLTAMALHVAAALVALGPPVLLGRIVDTVAGTAASDTPIPATIDQLALGIGILLLVTAAVTWAAHAATGVLGERLLAGLREGFLRDVVHLPLSTVEAAGTGDLISRASGDIDVLNHSVRNAVPRVVTAAVTTAIILAGAAWVSPVLALSVFTILPLLLPAAIWYRRRSPQVFADIRVRYATMTATLNESYAGARTVEALRWEQRRIDQLDGDIGGAWQTVRRMIRLRSVLFPATDLSMFLPLLTALMVGGPLALRGTISVGEVTTVAVLMQMLMVPLAQVVLSLDALQMGNAALARLVGTGTVEPDRQPSGRKPDEDPEIDIQLSGVRFGYTPDRDVLHGIDLTLRRGERLALVGPTGAGKSTIARLIAGIHPPREGAVTVGGVPLVELTADELRRRVVLVAQEHHVFVGTLADNLRLATPDASDDELVQALTRVGGATWLEQLPDGLETQLAAQHIRPTPGEAQLVAMARIALDPPPTLVLDEATSQLDTGAARRAESALAQVLRDRTVVMIAHRLHTAHDADRVGVIEQGRLVELGSHDELIQQGGAYQRLWETWQER